MKEETRQSCIDRAAEIAKELRDKHPDDIEAQLYTAFAAAVECAIGTGMTLCAAHDSFEWFCHETAANLIAHDPEATDVNVN